MKSMVKAFAPLPKELVITSAKEQAGVAAAACHAAMNGNSVRAVVVISRRLDA